MIGSFIATAKRLIPVRSEIYWRVHNAGIVADCRQNEVTWTVTISSRGTVTELVRESRANVYRIYWLFQLDGSFVHLFVSVYRLGKLCCKYYDKRDFCAAIRRWKIRRRLKQWYLQNKWLPCADLLSVVWLYM